MKIKAINFKPKQVEIVDNCRLYNTDIQYVCVSTGRQCGKSTTAGQIALMWAIGENQRDYRVGIFLPTYKQAREQFNRLKRGLNKVKSIKFNKSEFMIDFPNGSSIKYLTAENDNCRGFTFESIIIDEACFVDDEIFHSAILPTVAISLGQKNGKCLLVSTPKEKGWFYDYCMDISPGYKFITFTSYEGGLFTKEFLDDVRRKTPESYFRNEYLAEFMDGGSGLFEYNDAIVTYEITDKTKCTAAIDWGMENDYTVLTIMNHKKELCFIKRWRKIDWDIMMDEMVKILKEHGNPLCYAETNGIGNMPVKSMKKKYPNTREWNTTQTNKKEIILLLSKDIKTGTVKIPKIDYLISELEDYTFTFENGNMKFAAKNGSHDDCVMSLAICHFNNKQRGIKIG